MSLNPHAPSFVPPGTTKYNIDPAAQSLMQLRDPQGVPALPPGIPPGYGQTQAQGTQLIAAAAPAGGGAAAELPPPSLNAKQMVKALVKTEESSLVQLPTPQTQQERRQLVSQCTVVASQLLGGTEAEITSRFASGFYQSLLDSLLEAVNWSQAQQSGLIDFDESSGMWRALHGGFDTEPDLLAEEDQDELLSFYDWVIRIGSCF